MNHYEKFLRRIRWEYHQGRALWIGGFGVGWSRQPCVGFTEQAMRRKLARKIRKHRRRRDREYRTERQSS